MSNVLAHESAPQTAEPNSAPPSPRPRRAGLAHQLLEGAGWTWVHLGVDVLMGVLAVASAILGAQAAGVSDDGESVLWALPAVTIVLLWARGMYKRKVSVDVLDRIVPVVGAISIAAMVVLAWQTFADPDVKSGPLIARGWFFTLAYVGTARALLAVTQRQARARGYVGQPTLIVGAGEVGAQVARRLEEHPDYGLRPIGFLDHSPFAGVSDADRRVPVLGMPDELHAVARATGAKHVILAFSSAADRGLVPLVRQCEELGLAVSLVPRLFESITDRVALERLGGLPLLGLRSVDPKGWQFGCKYVLDRLAAAVAIFLLAPALAGIALAVKLSSPGPVLFRQRRVGRDGLAFDLLKFRSMRPAAGDTSFRPMAGHAPGGVEGMDRRTRVGRFLRRSALDELPQLFNVLKGDMSLIGPRPERPEFVELFREDLERYADRHRVKSGITGWAQVHGLRGQTSLSDRVEWDNFYIENWSLWLDLKILLLTVNAVFRNEDDA